MKKSPRKRTARTGMREEYDFSSGVRGKYAQRHARGTNVVVLEPDVAKAFRSPKAVNRALRSYIARSKRKRASGA